MEYITVRNNKYTDGILKFQKQESKEREQSDIKNVQNREERMENQFFKEEKTEENFNTSQKPHKQLMEDKASGDELGKNQESNTVIYGKKLKLVEKVKLNNKNQSKTRKTVNN